MNHERLAYFVMLGQAAVGAAASHPDTAPPHPLPISENYDLSVVLPSEARDAFQASRVYRLFYVFENYLRDFVLGVLTESEPESWWAKVPIDVQTEVDSLEKGEETKAWMGLGARDKISLTTLPQLLRIIDHRWKEDFAIILRDKSLIQEARHVAHIRNIVCHMSAVPDEAEDRVKLVMRDWFRAVAP
jgi:hypothetical protein